MARTAARALIDLLVDDWGVRHVFALPGDGINGLFEALRERRDDVQLIQVRHEEAAAFNACAYSKFTGKVGVCMATSGPGAIHLLNGLYDAKMDGASVLAITGQTYHDLIGTFYQQEVDLINLFADVSVYNMEVRSVSNVEALGHEAMKAALWRRGVAHISFPLDLQEDEAPTGYVARGLDPNRPSGHVDAAWSRPIVVPSMRNIEAAAAVFNAAERPAMLVGRGALGAGDEVIAVSEQLAAPIVHAYLGKAVVPARHPNHMGGIGLLGDRPGQLALEQCDALLIVGSSFPYMNYYPKPGQARCAQIDVDPMRIGLRYPVDIPLPGDSKATLEMLLAKLDERAPSDWLQTLQHEKQEWQEVLADRGTRDDVPLRPQRVAHELNRHLPDNAILCGDSGTNTTFFSRYLEVRPGMMASGTGNLATMASGLPYAIGAQVAHPDRRAVAFVGDGGFTMLMGELLTAVKYRLPIVVVILRNDYLGQIRWEQMAFNGNPEFGVQLHNPRSFADWAENCGARGWKVERPEELGPAFESAFATRDRPCVIEAVVDPLEPPLPPMTSTEFAINMARAMARGQRHAGRIALTLFRDKLDEVLVQGLGSIPGIRGEKGDGGNGGGDGGHDGA